MITVLAAPCAEEGGLGAGCNAAGAVHELIGEGRLSLADMQAIEPRLEATIFEVLSIDSALQARDSFGGTAPAEVAAHIKAARAAFLKNT